MKKNISQKTQKTKGKNITINMLAKMMSDGFDNLKKNIHTEINSLRTEIHGELSNIKSELVDFRQETKENFKELDGRIDIIDHRTIILKQVIEKDLKTPVRW